MACRRSRTFSAAASHTAVTTDSGIKDANSNDPNYGFGWGLPQWHNGDIDGSIAFLQVLSGGYTYAVLANTQPANDTGAFNLSGRAEDYQHDAKMAVIRSLLENW